MLIISILMSDCQPIKVCGNTFMEVTLNLFRVSPDNPHLPWTKTSPN